MNGFPKEGERGADRFSYDSEGTLETLESSTICLERALGLLAALDAHLRRVCVEQYDSDAALIALITLLEIEIEDGRELAGMIPTNE